MLGTILGKTIIFIEKIFRFNASSFPGRVVLKIFPNYLKKLKYPGLIIMVTGSSGKGSTTKLIKKVLENSNYKVCCNDEDSNLTDAITTAIIKKTKGKKIKADALVLEVDERYLKIITKNIKPNYVIITNITRDQPPRQGSYDVVFNEIFKGLNKNVHLILNGDDPILKKYSLIHKGKITYFGIDKTKFSFDKLDDIKDVNYCPKCKNKLEYNYFHYGSIGDYKCKNCDFKRDNIDYSITDINYKKKELIINNNINIKIENYILFNLYNIISTYAIADILSIDKEIIVETLNDYSMNKKIYEEFEHNKRNYTILNCKAENNATYNLSLIYTAMNTNKKTIVLGLREISRRYKHFDLSWLYDIYFELLNEANVDKIICAGPYAYDFATRLKYMNFDENKIIILKNLDNIKETIETKTSGDVFAILNFDYVKPFKNKIKEEPKK